MAKALNFDTGVVEYEINGAARVRFNPADIAFTEKFYNAFTQLADKQEEFQRQVDEVKDDKEEFFAFANERDAEMRGIIDGVFGEGVADAVFGELNCYAIAEGMPIWINFLFAVAEEIRDAYDEQGDKADPRMKQFDAKSQELLAKYKKKTDRR